MTAPRARDGREERGEQTREALLEAARSVFAERGFGAASVRQIAQRAGVAAPLVTYHFGSKERLWQAVVDVAMHGLRQRILAALAPGGTPRELAHRALDAYLDHLAGHPDVPRLIARAALDGDPHVLTMARDHLRPLATLGGSAWGPEANDAFLTFFGASVAPWLYAPLLTEAFGEDPLCDRALERRRAHLQTLVELVLRETP